MIIFFDHFNFIEFLSTAASLFSANAPSGHLSETFAITAAGVRALPRIVFTWADPRRSTKTHAVEPEIASDSFSISGGVVLIILIVLILLFGFGGYRLGPGVGYYGGGGISLILLIILILLLLKVI